ncbi:amyloid-beta A4 precursor protein-binding family A member 3 isoform X2 [Hyperolius riggenbachi]|uniref:amyloid-beta A4 precursor protein-binding family A member 3 isoform X2 n=1 Tax=Hyperolius riggenbachi TaxID=752182 RepID=UPI0035A3A629
MSLYRVKHWRNSIHFTCNRNPMASKMEKIPPSTQIALEAISTDSSEPENLDLCAKSPETVSPRADGCSGMHSRASSTQDVIMATDSQLERGSKGDAFHMDELCSELPDFNTRQTDSDSSCSSTSCQKSRQCLHQDDRCPPCPLHIAIGKGQALASHRSSDVGTAVCSHELFCTDSDTRDLFNLFQNEDGILANESAGTPLAVFDKFKKAQEYPVVLDLGLQKNESLSPEQSKTSSSLVKLKISEHQAPSQKDYQPTPKLPIQYPTLAKGHHEPEDFLKGVVFSAKYLGSTQLACEKHHLANTHMRQAQEAVDRVKAPEGESQPMANVDVVVSTQNIKVLTADTQEILMDHPLQTISYTADIGGIVVIMAHRKLLSSSDQPSFYRPHKMLCHIFQSVDAQLIAQAIGQAFSLAYQHILLSGTVDTEQTDPSQMPEQLYNADLDHFTKKDNSKEVFIQKQQGEVLGMAVVESGWGSLLPTVVIANLLHGGPAERSGELCIGDHVISVNGTSLVGLPFSTCQGLIRELKDQSEVTLSIVHCPPVVTAIIYKPHPTYQLGFCVEDGVICSLVRGGIAEKGGIRVGHRIIEINGQSVVATSHEKIIQTLLEATGEVHIKTMPVSTYRLLTGQEIPTYL